jgi:hypothetical protein
VPFIRGITVRAPGGRLVGSLWDSSSPRGSPAAPRPALRHPALNSTYERGQTPFHQWWRRRRSADIAVRADIERLPAVMQCGHRAQQARLLGRQDEQHRVSASGIRRCRSSYSACPHSPGNLRSSFRMTRNRPGLWPWRQCENGRGYEHGGQVLLACLLRQVPGLGRSCSRCRAWSKSGSCGENGSLARVPGPFRTESVICGPVHQPWRQLIVGAHG